MVSWKKILQMVSLASIFCVVQTLCGCILLDLFDTSDVGEFDDYATYYDEEGDPKIRPGLVLRVGVTASGGPVSEIVQEVGMTGEMMLPLIKPIKCEGLTLIDFQKKIVEAYSEFFIDPQATANFAYNPDNPVGRSPWGEVLVMGAVGRNGPVPMPPTRDLRVTRALMLAGGATNLGDKTKVRVSRRERDGTITRFKVDVVKIGERGMTRLDIRLKAGDVVWVPETWY